MELSGIRSTLCEIGAITLDSVEVLAERTRDREVTVYRDPLSGVIFIDDYYVGEGEYLSGAYRGDDPVTLVEIADCDRRFKDFASHHVGKHIVDFGCGRGLFLAATQGTSASVHGVELQTSYRAQLASQGIPCSADFSEVSRLVDTVFMFHVLEHLPRPIDTLSDARSRLAPGGSIVVEVPHARDMLLDVLHLEPFQAFTLWSQHLVLHTRDSLRRLLEYVGFTNVSIRAVQRFGLANHLQWLAVGRPSGLASPLAVLESEQLKDAYAAALAANDMTDTLVAVGYA